MLEGVSKILPTVVQSTRDKKDEVLAEQAEAMREIVAAIECDKCLDLGVIEEPMWKDAYGLAAVVYERMPINQIDWCDCSSGYTARMSYKLKLLELQRNRVSHLISEVYPDAVPPPIFDNTTLALPPQLLRSKRRAVAAIRMWMEKGVIIPAKLGDYDAGAGIQSKEVYHRPNTPRYGLVLHGAPGVGKTGCLTVAYRHAIEQDRVALWLEARTFLATIQGAYGSPRGEAEKRMEAALGCELLFLDDLGDPKLKGVETTDKRGILWRLINHRHDHQMQTLITTNLTRAKMVAQLDERFVQRLEELCFWAGMDGTVLREIEL